MNASYTDIIIFGTVCLKTIDFQGASPPGPQSDVIDPTGPIKKTFISFSIPYENGPRWLPRYLEKAEVITSVFGENPGITEKAPVLRTTALESRGNFQNTAVFDTGAFESRGLATGAFENRGICSKLPVVLPTGSFKTAAHFHKGF